MNIILILFAIPIATVILAIVLQKILKSPVLVAATFFAIFLIVTFAFADSNFLILAILYTILAYITAVLTKIICRLIRTIDNKNDCNCRIVERPITINNTSPCNSINLGSDGTLIPSTTSTDTNTNSNTNAVANTNTTAGTNAVTRINGNCNCCCRCRNRC